MKPLAPVLPAVLPLALAAAFAAPAFAQDAEVGSAGPKDRRDATFLQRAEDTDVMNTDGEKIGEVEDVLIDAEGRVSGFLIEFDRGLFDFGDDEVAVPLDALTWDGSRYVSKMTQEQLDNLTPWDE